MSVVEKRILERTGLKKLYERECFFSARFVIKTLYCLFLHVFEFEIKSVAFYIDFSNAV